MDIDRGLIASALREKSYQAFNGVSDEMIKGDALSAFQFVREYFFKYQDLPSAQLIFNETGIDLIQGVNLQEPSGFFKERIVERHLFERACLGVSEVVNLLEHSAPVKEVRLALSQLIFSKLTHPSVSDATPKSIFANPELLLSDYHQARHVGITGIASPWPTLNRMTMGFQKEDFTLFVARPGVGKCLGRGTKVIMSDGSIKNVEDIEAGEQVMGPDSKPRNVLSTNTGREMMYRITPVKGEPWECNESHVLSLRISSARLKEYHAGQIVNISVKDYIKEGAKFKHQAKLWRTGVDFPEKPTPIEPYLIGRWLGDGLSSVWRISNNYKGNVLTDFLRAHCYVDKQKTIPHDYLINSRSNRLQLLAGLIDTDGSLIQGCYEIATKFTRLKDDILFLARSLGFAAYAKTKSVKLAESTGTYWRIHISGDISLIPVKFEAEPRRQKKKALVTGFKIEPVGEGDYYGFTLDGDHLFLLGDFTVTHNTWVLMIILYHAWKNGNKVMLFSTEMSELQLKRRAAVLMAEVSYGRVKKGRLSESEYKHFEEQLFHHRDDTRFLVVGNDTSLKRSIVEENLILHKPDIVAIDGYYMLHDDIEKYNQNDLKMGGIWKSGKQMAKTHKIPLLVSHQLNRPDKASSSAQNAKPDLSRLAYSDATGQYADYVFGIRQTEEMFLDKTLQLIPMKARDAEEKVDIEIKWDLEHSLYHEIDKGKTFATSEVVSDFQPQQKPNDDVPF